MTTHGRRHFLTAVGGSSTTLLAGCGSSGSGSAVGDRKIERVWFRVRSNGNIQFALRFEDDIDVDSLEDPEQFINVSNGATVELDGSVTLDWYDHATVDRSSLSRARDRSIGEFDSLDDSDWDSLTESYTGSVAGAERPGGVTGRIRDAVATVDPSEFGEIELEIPEIAVTVPVADGPDTVQVQYPDGQIHSAPYVPPSLDEDELVLTDRSFDGEFTVDFENERITWESKNYEGENEWEFPTGTPTEGLNTRQIEGEAATILVENSIVALSPAYGSLRAIWRSRWEFFDWVASIAVDPTAAAEQVADNATEVVRETLGWLGPTGSSDVAEQYMIAGLQVGVALRYSAQAARVAGGVASTLTTAVDIAAGYQKVTALADETNGLIKDVMKGFDYSYINPAVHPLLHRFMAEKASVSIATHNGDSNIEDYRDVVEKIAGEYDAAYTQVNTEYAGGNAETRQLQSRIHDSVKRRVEILRTAKVNDIVDTALTTAETRSPVQPATQFQLDNANTGFDPDLLEPSAEGKPAAERLSAVESDVRPVVADGRVYGCSGSRLLAFDQGREMVWEQPLNGDGDIVTTPTVDDGVIYVGTDEPALYALELGAEGLSQQWRLADTFEENPLSPTVHDGRLYTATGAERLYQISSASEVTETVELSFGGPTSPRQSLATDGQRLFVSGQYGIRAFDVPSLAPAWETARETADYTNDVPAVSTDGPRVVYSPEGNELVARQPADGTTVWRSERDTFASVPTVTAERVFVGSGARQELRAYPRGTDRATPRPPESRVELDGDIVGEVTAAGAHVYCSTAQSVYCLDRASLDTVWRVDDALGGNTVSSTPVVSGGRVYVATTGGIFALGE
ncbi:outer membrane protein assembly factor BamB family protein [Halostella salina]|uniref:outer membrane protein assembly factor BamB family protein n=1 Tax=Halostella salina TaxID=1547897 RepID=UPI000EF82D96|nr:PQQ-binding-like beta-propeller repeat protein [Halostella salina]